MRKSLIIVLTVLLAACATSPSTTKSLQLPPPPATEARPKQESLHGVDITDPYAWLEDQKAPEVREWIAQQNAYTDKLLGTRPEIQQFVPRLTELMSTDQFDFPTYRNGRYFYRRRAAGQDLYSIYVRDSVNGPDQLLIDPAPLSTSHTTSVDVADVSNDGSLLAYSVRQGGADEVEIHFYDVKQKKEIGQPLTEGRYQSVNFLTLDKPGAFYTRMTRNGMRLYYRDVEGGDERMLFGEKLTVDKIMFANLSPNGRYLLIHVFHGSAPKKTEIYVEDLSDAEPVATVVNDLDARSIAYLAGDKLVIQTNWNAPNERLMITDIKTPSRSNWRELVPENKNAAIQGVTVAGGRVYVRYLENVQPRITGYDLDGHQEDTIRFDTYGNLEDMQGSFEEPVAFFRFSSIHIPPTVYQYDVAKSARTMFAQQNAPVKADDFVVEQVFYPSKDGTRVPMFLLYKKGLQKNGANPTYLGGYGGFLQSQLPTFSPRAVVFAEKGGVYAVANLRGGGEYGEAWHRAGMLDKKQNTFDDFAAAAEYLIRERYTSSEHLAVAGGSNGGLLVAAFATQHPELANAVICRFPLIDMLRYHRFLVGSFWIPEYGSPEIEQDFKWIYPYSPYQHVTEGTKYPAMLFISGDSDTRVAPLHARKMTAMMQAANGSNNPILLRYHVSSGHSGGEPLHEQVHNQAEELGFLWWRLR